MSSLIEPAALFLRVLSFLTDVSESQMAIFQKTKAAAGGGGGAVDTTAAALSARSSIGLLDFADLHVECLWRLFEVVDGRIGATNVEFLGAESDGTGNGAADSSSTDMIRASGRVHVILLLHILTPVLTEKTSHPDHRGASNKFLKLLCSFIDRERNRDDDDDIEDEKKGDDDDTKRMERRKRMIAECERRVSVMTLTDGAAVFFPDKEARRKQLFSMMTTSATAANNSAAVTWTSSMTPIASPYGDIVIGDHRRVGDTGTRSKV